MIISLETILNSLNNLTESELIELNGCVVQNIKAVRTRRSEGIRASLCVGDSVTFLGRKRGVRGSRFTVEGTVVKVKRKNADVSDLSGTRWSVPISLLTKVA